MRILCTNHDRGRGTVRHSQVVAAENRVAGNHRLPTEAGIAGASYGPDDQRAGERGTRREQSKNQE